MPKIDRDKLGRLLRASGTGMAGIGAGLLNIYVAALGVILAATGHILLGRKRHSLDEELQWSPDHEAALDKKLQSMQEQIRQDLCKRGLPHDDQAVMQSIQVLKRYIMDSWTGVPDRP